VNLELGGKDPFIVCADVAGEIQVAARGGAWAALLNAATGHAHGHFVPPAVVTGAPRETRWYPYGGAQ
jgi:hypothetical protein